MMITVLLSLGVALTLLEPLSFAEGAPSRWAAAAIAAYLILAATFAAANTAVALRARAAGRMHSPQAAKRRRLAALGIQVYLVAGLAVVLLAGFRSAILSSTVAAWPLVPVLLAWAPFAAALLVIWVLDYPLYRAVRMESSAAAVWSLREFVSYNLRHHVLFVVVPVGLIIFVSDAMAVWICPRLPERAAGYVLAGGSLAGAGAVFLVAPALIVRIWRTAPLPRGALREELEALCRRLRLRYRDILIWRSGGVIANAAMMGLIGPIRYVLISDALLAQLDTRSIRAIFAHEAGHIRHHHIFYSVLFALAAAALCGAVAQQAAIWANLGDDAATLGMLGLLAAAWAMGFGWISRRFERQSDVLGARMAGAEPLLAAGDPSAEPPVTPEGTAVFCSALHRVAALNGMSLTQRNWRHGSVAARIAYLMVPRRVADVHPADRQVRWIKTGLWAALILAAAANAVQYWLYPAVR